MKDKTEDVRTKNRTEDLSGCWQDRIIAMDTVPPPPKPEIVPESETNSLKIKVLVLQRELLLAKAENLRYQLRELGVQS